MTAVLTMPSPPRPSDGDERRQVTLDRVIVEAWAKIGEHGVTSCPLCGHAMTPVYGAQARPVAGRCSACRTELL